MVFETDVKGGRRGGRLGWATYTLRVRLVEFLDGVAVALNVAVS